MRRTKTARIFNSPITVDVAIIGAGIIGAVLARELSRFELRVVLLEKDVDVAVGASKANSGIVHSGLHDAPGTLKAKLCIEGNRLYPELCADLDVPFRSNGALVVARDESERISLERLYRQGRENDVFGLELLSRDELSKIEPNLSPALTAALWAPSGGIVAPFELVFALTENAISNGVNLLLQTEVKGMDRDGEDFILQTNRSTIRSRFLVNAAGVESGRIARMIKDDSFEIFPRKGEEYLMDRRLGEIIHRTVFPLPTPESKGILAIPTVEGNLMIGPTAQSVEDGNDRGTTAQGWEGIFREARQLLPSLSSADLISAFAGLRAVSDREDFILEASPIHPRFIHAAGIKSPGLTAAPAIAFYLLDLLHDVGLNLIPNKQFHPERRVIRMRDMDRQRQDALIRSEPGYSRIVCRCETVSEQEIRDAVCRGATTLDGVKLRARCGMGRCQGGFCTPSVIRIISDELGVPPETITKCGPGSELLVGRLRNGGEVLPDA